MLSPSSIRFAGGRSIRVKPLALAFCCVLSLVLLFHAASSRGSLDSIRSPNWLAGYHGFLHSSPADPNIANATLGFQKIFAVSGENVTAPGSWRQKGLIGAAERSGLDIEVMQQRDFSVKEYFDFRSNGEHHPGEGSALAWMAHLDVLKHIVDSSITSALIVEDDMDWDVWIRNLTAPNSAFAYVMRNLTDAPAQDSILEIPYGLSWDLMWLGHCGISAMQPEQHMIIADDNMVPVNKTKALWGLAYLDLGDNRRQITSHIHATCTYAYAVTLEGAKKAIPRLSRGGNAYDNELAAGCADQDLTCLGVAPELFHQQYRQGNQGLIHDVDKKLEEKKKGGQSQQKSQTQKDPPPRVWTMNIKYSARCNAGKASDNLVQCLPTDEELEHNVV